MSRKAVLAVGVLSLVSFNIAAQGRYPLRGEITAEGPVRFQDFFVELLAAGNLPADRVAVAPDGRFEFPAVEAGPYRLRLTTLNGDTVREEFIQARDNAGPVTIALRGAPAPKPGGMISARRLAHKPPKAAMKAWKEAGKRSEKGDHAGAVSYLEQCVALDPEYFEAHLNLGSERVRTGDVQGALTAYDRALEIDSSSAPALINRGMVLLHFKRAQEAEESARKALTLGDSESAHYVLGLSLAVQGEDLPEAVEHLRQSAGRHPQALKTVERIETHMKTYAPR